MSDQHGRRGESLYHCGNTTGLPDSLFVERIWARLEREAEAEMDPNETKVLPKKVTRQINYRRRREASLARDTPPLLLGSSKREGATFMYELLCCSLIAFCSQPNYVIMTVCQGYADG